MPLRPCPGRHLAWLLLPACAVATAAAPSADSTAARLMAQYHCGSCHRIPGVAADAGSSLAADLRAYGRRSYIAGRWPNDAATLARWIADPPAMAPDTLMPALGVSPAEARAMAAYLLALRE